jgi:hypothetical protein
MKLLATAAVLGAALAGCSQTGPNPQATPLSQAQIGALASSLGPTHTSKLVQNPASCSPDQADPVWGPGQQLLGYSCYRAPVRGY